MASYPSIPTDNESTMEVVDLGRRDVTAAGVRTRTLTSAELYRFQLAHSYVTKAQAESVRALWATDPAAVVELTWRDGYTYDCYWDGPPIADKDHPTQLWLARARLIGERQP